MRLSTNDLTYLCEQAIVAARQAGECISSYANKNVPVKEKQGGVSYASQVVTEVDLLSEEIIVDVLKPTCERYDLALLTEERVDDKTRFEKDYFWCVDPMDGTLSFIESAPGYSVSIALVSKLGEAIIGVIYNPLTQSLYSAVQGQGVLRNDELWRFAPEDMATAGKPLTMIYDRGFLDKPFYPQLEKAIMTIANKHGYTGVETFEKNGAVLNACWVLENPPAIYFKCPKSETGGGSLWDFAATAALFNELNVFVSDFYGKPLDLNRADSVFMNHRGVIFTTDELLFTDIQALVELCSTG